MRFGLAAVALAGATFALIGCGGGSTSGSGGTSGGGAGRGGAGGIAGAAGGAGARGGSGGRGGATAGAGGAGGSAAGGGGTTGTGGATAGASGSGGSAGVGGSAGGTGGAIGGAGGATGGRGGSAGATGGAGGNGGRGGSAGSGGAMGGASGSGGRGGSAGSGGTGGATGGTGGRGGSAGTGGAGGATGGTGGTISGGTGGFPDCSISGSGARSPFPLSFAAKDYPMPVGAVGPNMVAISDLNVDGKPDLAVAVLGNAYVSVFLNKGSGLFDSGANYLGGGGVISVTVADLNGDGKPDFAVPNSCFMKFAILLNAGDGTYGYLTQYPTDTACPAGLAAGDFNRDGKMDLVLSEGDVGDRGSGVNFLRGNGDGTVTAGTVQKAGLSPQSVEAADLNADGKLDLVIVNSGLEGFGGGPPGVSVMLGNGDGLFATPVFYPTRARMVVIGDVNADGKPDIVAASPPPVSSNPGGTVQVLLNTGNGSFTGPVGYEPGEAIYGPTAIAMGDVNGDCRPDLVVDNSTKTAGQITILVNKGNGVFGDPVNFPYPAVSVSVGDLDLDGRPDIVLPVTGGAGKVTVLLNTSH